MKRWARPILYSIIVLLSCLAFFGGSDDASTTSVVEPVYHPHHSSQDASGLPINMPVLIERGDKAFSPNLFKTNRRPVEPDPDTPEEALTVDPPPVAAPVLDMKVLGWMRKQGKTVVFVEFGGDYFVLALKESVKSAYRFDSLGGGEAVFTYLPTGVTRTFPVSDPKVDQ